MRTTPVFPGYCLPLNRLDPREGNAAVAGPSAISHITTIFSNAGEYQRIVCG
jgi:hypothetical protein